MIFVAQKAAEANPALCRWLSGTGLCVTNDPAAAAARILDQSEAADARPCDVVIELTHGQPSLQLSDGAAPMRLRFGFEDMPFGHALACELVRPADRPACGEPESARLLTLAEKIAASEASVLVFGETGTGKKGIARFIHSCSPRASGAFVFTNCAALPEAMLFGEAGGDEGLLRAANGGTLVLDDLAELPIPLQAKLLRALEEQQVLPIGAAKPERIDVRVIACAGEDLAADVAEGRFRADLYWRLNVMPLSLKPLGARRLDIRAITAALLVRRTAAAGVVPWPTTAALDRLMAHSWPGNARELDNVLQRALLVRQSDRIEADDLSIETMLTGMQAERLSDASRSAERQMIRAALAATGGHRLRAAERLGISERTLRYRLAQMRDLAA